MLVKRHGGTTEFMALEVRFIVQNSQFPITCLSPVLIVLVMLVFQLFAFDIDLVMKEGGGCCWYATNSYLLGLSASTGFQRSPESRPKHERKFNA